MIHLDPEAGHPLPAGPGAAPGLFPFPTPTIHRYDNHVKPRGKKVALASAIALLLLLPVVLWTNWADILFLIDFESLGRNEQGYPEYRHRQTGIVFVSLPGGTFLMGSTEDEEYRSDETRPVHEVALSPVKSHNTWQ